MIKKTFFIYLLLSIYVSVPFTSKGQTLTFFPHSYSFCDPGTYKLVFYDEFNGRTDQTVSYPGVYYLSQLDSHRWDYESPGDIYHATVHASNVIPNDGSGICHELVQTQMIPPPQGCTDCPNTQIFTTGEIGTPSDIGTFTYGKFEARISFPSFYFAHSNFYIKDWLGISYISGCETYGQPLSVDPFDPVSSGHQHMEVSSGVGTVQWRQRLGANWAATSYFHYADLFDGFHIYTFEWDLNMLTWSIDGSIRPLV